MPIYEVVTFAGLEGTIKAFAAHLPRLRAMGVDILVDHAGAADRRKPQNTIATAVRDFGAGHPRV
jgi:hypothetical protein